MSSGGRAAEAASDGLLVVGLEGNQLDRRSQRMLEDVRPAGVILFRRNMKSPEDAAELAQAIRRLLGPDVLLFMDQEGGMVDKLRQWVPWAPSAMALGAADDAVLTTEAGRREGELLRLLGVDVNLAPVVDLALSTTENGIGTRSFGHELGRVAKHARSLIEGLEAAGIQACLKHFPGLGTSEQDSHVTLPVLPLRKVELERGELALYRTLKSRAGAVLVGHGYYPELARSGIEPASLSPDVVGQLLKGELGFQGVALSDDLTMGAVAMEEIGEASVKALRAGCDLILVCKGDDNARRAVKGLRQAVAKGRVPARRLDDAHTRARALCARARRLQEPARVHARFDPQAFAEAAHSLGQLARRVGRQAATRLAGKARMPRKSPLLVLRPRLDRLERELERQQVPLWEQALEARGRAVMERGYDPNDPEALLEGLEPNEARAAVLVTHSRTTRPRLERLVAGLASRGLTVFHLTLGVPFLLGGAALQVATYDCGREAVEAGLEVLAGKLKPRGYLPVPAELLDG